MRVIKINKQFKTVKFFYIIEDNHKRKINDCIFLECYTELKELVHKAMQDLNTYKIINHYEIISQWLDDNKQYITEKQIGLLWQQFNVIEYFYHRQMMKTMYQCSSVKKYLQKNNMVEL